MAWKSFVCLKMVEYLTDYGKAKALYAQQLFQRHTKQVIFDWEESIITWTPS